MQQQVAATDHSLCTGPATSCSNTLRRHVAATSRFVCTGEFCKNLRLCNRIFSQQQVAQILSDYHIQRLTGKDIKQDWQYQFLDRNCPDLLSLSNKVNNFFTSLTDHFTPLEPPVLAPQEVPPEFPVSEREAFQALSAVKIGKAIGPDCIPNRVLKEFAQELAPVVKDIYNASLIEGYFPDALKASLLNPIPKISPPQQIESDLRPIALTCSLAKVLEGFTRDRLITQVFHQIGPRQFARAGHSTTDALIYMYLLQAVYEAVDSGSCGARMFFADYFKGFDKIDHSVLIEELRNMHVHPVLVNWMIAFLCNRTQAVRTLYLSGKLPRAVYQRGTKLGVILFTIMTNNLLRSWNLRIKFVDETTALEIIPRNSASLLNFVTNDIYAFSVFLKITE